MDCQYLFSDYDKNQHSEFSETFEVLNALLDPSTLENVTQQMIERVQEPEQAPVAE